MTIPVTRELAAFVRTTAWGDLPETAQHAARRTAGNALALATGAAEHPAVAIALRTLMARQAPEQAGLLGRPERLGLLDSPLINGIGMHVEDFDDTHLRTVVHPGAPVVPAALAAAEWVGASGTDTLTAIAVGIEVALRVGNGICPEHFNLGWHLTSTVGHLGAAAAAGKLLELTEDQLVVALGLGATQAAGLTAALGTMTKPFHPGKAASDGVEAALLAARGFTGPEQPIEGRRGFAHTASPKVDLEAMVVDLGRSWELEANAFKPYACGIVSHPVIDAGILLRDLVDPDDIDRVEVTVHPVVLEVMGVEDPRDGLQSKFSVYHAFAMGLLDAAGGPHQFSGERARAPEVVALRGRVTITTTPDVPKGAAQVTVHTTDGEQHRVEVPHATGSVERPMTDDQLRTKADLVARPRLGDRTDAFLDLAFGIDALPRVEDLFAASQPEVSGD